MKNVSVIIFPGSNCDHDVIHLCSELGATVTEVWHQNTDLNSPDLVILPGGFSYGDYLRTGALAKISPAMQSVKEFAASGGRVIGICNGFQILCESGLLPGVLLPNVGRRFLSKFVSMKVEKSCAFVTPLLPSEYVITCPIAHFEGQYFAEPSVLVEIESNNQVVFRYTDQEGLLSPEHNPNGSVNNIAGICNKEGNVIGFMPHPERAADRSVGFVGKTTGRVLFERLVS